MDEEMNEEHREGYSSDTLSPGQNIARVSIDSNSLGNLFRDLNMSTPAARQTTFEMEEMEDGEHGLEDDNLQQQQQQQRQHGHEDGSNSLRNAILPSMCDAESMHQYSSEYQDGSQLPKIKDIMPAFDIDTTRKNSFDLSVPRLGEPVQLSRIPRSIDPLRLRNRGHSDGFTSFGERASVDMPGASLEHFSLSKRRRSDEDDYYGVDGDDDGDEDGDDENEGGGRPRAARRRARNDPNLSESILVRIMKHPELAIFLARFLRVQDLISLYAISRDFHGIVNHRFTTVVMSQALKRAPESARIFPFRCYATLCQEDPAERPHPLPRRAIVGDVRTVPTFRWLKMICFREMVVHQIMVMMAEDGVPVPGECRTAIKKLWLLMDIPDNLRRIGLIQNDKIFSDQDLFFATMFFIKLDMRFTDPLTGSGTDGMKRMLLSQPSLSYLWRALRRTILVSKLDVIRMFVRWKYVPEESERDQTIFGIPPEEVGIVQYEAWGKSTSRIPLQRPDELVMKESIRRGLKLHKKYTDMFLWGYVNPNTFENLGPQVLERSLGRLEGLEKELIPPQDRKKVIPEKQVSFRVIQRRDRLKGNPE
ncbi:hypothetical protein KEM54_003400 [Ascosphaera aggregata]|nr:hypothetical protein KEM54_003400 [Ascosphaera aggregata]